MENLALTTILLLILALPGYVAQRLYHSGNLNKAVLPRNLTGDVTTAFLLSLPIHFVGIAIVEHLNHTWGVVPDINPEIVGRLIAGEYGPDSVLFPDLIDNGYQNIHWIIAYAFLITVLSSLGGLLTREVVWRKRLDLRYPNIFGFGSSWLYRLTGRDNLRGNPTGQEVIPIVDALVNLGDKTRLYRGIVSDFATDESGALREIFLVETVRGKFGLGENEEAEFYWEDIPGDTFVLKYPTVLNLNITYLTPPDDLAVSRD